MKKKCRKKKAVKADAWNIFVRDLIKANRPSYHDFMDALLVKGKPLR